jgi:4-hydroxy-tetrahydrodipicolinate reductase
VVAGFDVNPEKRNDYPVYADPMEFPGKADCIIDFSHPNALTGLLSYCKSSGCGIVLATTGYSEAQLEEIQAASKEIRIFKSANMSLGINVLLALVKQAAKVLGSTSDIEIVEKHHNRKLDAPSGTALMIADAAASALPYEPDYTFERHSVRQKRGKTEIGISSVRGGTIVGEHEILFAGTDEVLEIKHTAYSREIFATGAVKAAAYIGSLSEPGLYNMENLVSEVL